MRERAKRRGKGKTRTGADLAGGDGRCTGAARRGQRRAAWALTHLREEAASLHWQCALQCCQWILFECPSPQVPTVESLSTPAHQRSLSLRSNPDSRPITIQTYSNDGRHSAH